SERRSKPQPPWPRSGSGSIQCEQGDVLHLALEDNERRLKERQAALLGDGTKPDRVEYNTTWPRLSEGHGSGPSARRASRRGEDNHGKQNRVRRDERRAFCRAGAESPAPETKV